MARRRYITTDISTDAKVAELAEEAGPFAVLLYTWLIPHLDDWGRMGADPREIKLTVVPAFLVKSSDVEEALQAIANAGLIELYEVDGKRYLAVDQDVFYKYQTYIPEEKRKNDKSQYPPPPNTEERRKTPQSTAEGSEVVASVPSPSPSPSPSPKGEGARESASGSSGSQAFGLAGDNFDTGNNEQRDHTTFWRDPGEIPNEEAFRELPAKQQLNIIVKEHQRLCPEQYKRFGVGGISKARDVFAEAIASGLDAWRLFIQVAFWDAESDGPDPPPWEVVRPLNELGPGPDQITEQYLRYTMDRQAATEGVQVCGSTAVNAL